MKKIVVLPSDPMQAYLDKGQTYEYYYNYFNPGGYFDEVFALSPWGGEEPEVHAGVTYIKSNPKNFKRIISEINPNVVRAYGGYHCADWLAISSVENIPTVVSIHDTNPKLIYSSIKYADNIIYMADCVKDAVKKKINASFQKEWVMGNRIDTSVFAYTEDKCFFHQLDERFGKGKHILHVGRKSEQKNLDTLIKSLQYLPDDVSVIFVGRGDFKPYKQLAMNYNVENRVFNVDYVNNVDLPKWYSWCDCFCTPSRWEGFGVVFIEAASCKTSIITSDISPMNEYLTNGKDSILVKCFEDPREIANAIRYVLENKAELNGMKDNARLIGERFSKEHVDSQEISIYEDIIKAGVKNRKKISIFNRKKIEWKYRNY